MSASLLGGVRASYSLESPIQNFWESKILLESQLVTSLSIQVSCKLKVIAVIPDFKLPTSVARSVLPSLYSRSDIVYNLQRIAVLSIALKGDQEGNLDSKVISECLKDKIHQP